MLDWTPSLLHRAACLTDNDVALLLDWYIQHTLSRASHMYIQPVHTEKQFILCSTLWFVESQLSAHHTCINNVPEVITDAAICIVVADLHSTLPQWWLRTIHQSDVTICACCERSTMLNNNFIEVYVESELTASGHISRNESWDARSAYVAASSVVTFCIHTEISTQLTFIDIWKEEVSM